MKKRRYNICTVLHRFTISAVIAKLIDLIVQQLLLYTGRGREIQRIRAVPLLMRFFREFFALRYNYYPFFFLY